MKTENLQNLKTLIHFNTNNIIVEKVLGKCKVYDDLDNGQVR